MLFYYNEYCIILYYCCIKTLYAFFVHYHYVIVVVLYATIFYTKTLRRAIISYYALVKDCENDSNLFPFVKCTDFTCIQFVLFPYISKSTQRRR